MSDITTDKLTANIVQADETSTGNLVVSGKASFLQPIRGSLDGSKNINDVNTGTIANTDYVLFSNGTNLYKVQYSDLITDLSSKVTPEYPDSEGVGY